MKTPEKTLLQLLGRALFDLQIILPETINWHELYVEASQQAVFSLIYDTLTSEERMRIPSEEKRQWDNSVMQRIYSNEQILSEQRTVLEILQSRNIPCVILKGSSVALNYPKPHLRAMGDIDLLVAPEKQMEVVQVLQGVGYGDVLEEKHHCHMTITKDGVAVEVHKEPNGLYLNYDAELSNRIRGFFSDAIDVSQHVGDIPILSDKHQAVVLILHKLEHFLNGGLGLRQLCDWAMFVYNRMTGELWLELKPILEEFGLLYFTGIITKCCVEYLNLPSAYALWAEEYDAELALEVMERILQSGNFGVKDFVYGERYFSDASSSNRVFSMFKVLGTVCKQHWPVCERYKALYPVAPFVILCKYLKLTKQGRKPVFKLKAAYKQAGAKQRLFRELKPFMVDK